MHTERATAPHERVCLQIARFGAAYSGRTVLHDVELTIGARGVHLLVGPTATGKSTLLRCVAGLNRNRPAAQIWGDVTYRGRALGEAGYPAMVTQNATHLTSTLQESLIADLPQRMGSTPETKRALAQDVLSNANLEEYADRLGDAVVGLPLVIQRIVAIARLIATDPALLCLDEPTTGLDEQDAMRLLELVRQQGERRAIILVLHNQRQMRAIGGSLSLLAGGKIQETRRTGEFFRQPHSLAGRQFVGTGSCNLPSPSARPEDLDADILRCLQLTFRHTRAGSSRAKGGGPHGFAWLLPKRLAGTPGPGIVADLNDDLQALRRVGVSVLITLTTQNLEEGAVERSGLRSYWYPIPDMQAPSLEVAQRICRRIDVLLDGGETVAVHCHAGHGRTGTILVAYLIWQGKSAPAALEEARRIEPKWVQSHAQLVFLENFADTLSKNDMLSAAARDTQIAQYPSRAHSPAEELNPMQES